MKIKTLSVYLFWLLIFFQGISGIGGGIYLILDPKGISSGMPVTLLVGSPFQTFLIPGLLLLFLLGIFPIVALWGLVRSGSHHSPLKINLYSNKRWGWTYSFYVGIMLIIWINVQIMIMGGGHFLQTFYAFTGIAIVIAAMLPSVKNYYTI